jgi:sulfur dioxygenase
LIKQRLPTVKSVIGAAGKPAVADKYLEDGEELAFGEQKLIARSTPGHTNGCTTYVLGDKSMAFTGDTLFIRGCGRTDFQQGSSDSLYESVHQKIFTLPDECRLFPGHDYNGRTETTVEEEKKLNPRLTKSKPDFIQLMKDLKLANPAKIDVAVPGNMICGYVVDVASTVIPEAGIASRMRLPNVSILDLRSKEEREKVAGVPGAVELDVAGCDAAAPAIDAAIADKKIPEDKYAPIVVYCLGGKRAGIACERLRALGYNLVANAGSAEQAVAAAQSAKM